MAQQGTPINPIAAGLDLASELIVPGGSNLLRGNFVQGGVHMILGFAARAVFGVPFMALVSANSMTRALTGRNLMDHLEMPASAPALVAPSTPAPAQPASQAARKSSKATAARKKTASKK